MGLFDHLIQLIGKDNSTKASVDPLGSKGAVAVAIQDASGNQITSFGGGAVTQGTDPWNTKIDQNGTNNRVQIASGGSIGREIGYVFVNGEPTPIRYAAVDAATSGDNTIVAAVAGKKIRVLSAFVVSAGTVNTRFESAASGTALTGQMNLVVNTGYVLPYNEMGWFETLAGQLLNLELSGAVSVDGSISYILV